MIYELKFFANSAYLFWCWHPRSGNLKCFLWLLQSIFHWTCLAGIYPWLKRPKQAKPVLLIVTWLLKLIYKFMLETCSSKINPVTIPKFYSWIIMCFQSMNKVAIVFLRMSTCNKLFLIRKFVTIFMRLHLCQCWWRSVGTAWENEITNLVGDIIYVGVIRLIFLLRHLYLIGVWLGSKNAHHNDTCLKEIALCLQILLTTPHSTLNTSRRTYACS